MGAALRRAEPRTQQPVRAAGGRPGRHGRQRPAPRVVAAHGWTSTATASSCRAGLGRYRNVPEIPRDPYDIPVSLAKRLFGYQQTIELRPPEQALYDRAFKLSGDHRTLLPPLLAGDVLRGTTGSKASRVSPASRDDTHIDGAGAVHLGALEQLASR